MALIFIPCISVKVVILSIVFLSLFPVCIALLSVFSAKAARFPIESVRLASVRPVLIRKVLLLLRIAPPVVASARPMMGRVTTTPLMRVTRAVVGGFELLV